MMAVRKIVRFLALAIGGIAALLIVFYLVLLAVNWHDQAPSASVVEIHREFADRPSVPDEQNAYVYAWGFTAPAALGPQRLGEEIVLSLKRKAEDASRARPDASVDNEFRAARPPQLSALMVTCEKASVQCLQDLQLAKVHLEVWIAARSLQLSRYAELKQRSAWQEVMPSRGSFPLTPFGPIMDAQKLTLIALWYRAPAMQAAEVADALDRDFRFWRSILANADTLITKMIAVAGMRRNFAIGELVIRRIDPEAQEAATPTSWSHPLTREELSMLQVMSAEVLYSEDVLLQTKSSMASNSDEDSVFGSWVGKTFVLPLFQPQDTVSKMAEYRIAVAKRYLVPLEQYPELFRRAGERTHRFLPHLYNPIGNLLHAIAEDEYDKYAVRVGDLEGMRRAALLTVKLRSEGLDARVACERLKTAALRNPYTQKPFEWSSTDQGVEFIGLEKDERGRQTYLY